MTAWPFSPPAGRARGRPSVLGPFVGLPVGCPRSTGPTRSPTLPRPALICPNHASHLDIPVLRRALCPRARRLAIAAPTTTGSHQRRPVRGARGSPPSRSAGRRAFYRSTRSSALLADGWRGASSSQGSRAGRELPPVLADRGLAASGTRITRSSPIASALGELLPPCATTRPSSPARQRSIRRPSVRRAGESARAFTSGSGPGAERHRALPSPGPLAPLTPLARRGYHSRPVGTSGARRSAPSLEFFPLSPDRPGPVRPHPTTCIRGGPPA